MEKEGREMVGGRVSLRTVRAAFCECTLCVCLFIFHRPQREIGRESRTEEREGSTSRWALMPQFSTFRLFPCTVRCIMIDFTGETGVGKFGV